MLETIEKLLILQDRDRKIRRVQGELEQIEPERQTLKARASGAILMASGRGPKTMRTFRGMDFGFQ